MCSDRVSNSGALALESETLLTAPRGPAINFVELEFQVLQFNCPTGYGEEEFLGFTIHGHGPSWSCDLAQICNICKLSSPLCLH